MSPRWNQNKDQSSRSNRSTSLHRGVSTRSRAIRRERPLYQGVLGVRAQRSGRLYTIREIQILGRVLSANQDESDLPDLSLLASRTMNENEPPIYIDVMAGGDVELRDEEYFYMQPILFVQDAIGEETGFAIDQNHDFFPTSDEDPDGIDDPHEDFESDANNASNGSDESNATDETGQDWDSEGDRPTEK